MIVGNPNPLFLKMGLIVSVSGTNIRNIFVTVVVNNQCIVNAHTSVKFYHAHPCYTINSFLTTTWEVDHRIDSIFSVDDYKVDFELYGNAIPFYK